LADLIREIRDAARVREEVLLSRVCSMLEAAGKTDSANHLVSIALLLVFSTGRRLTSLQIKKFYVLFILLILDFIDK